MRHPKIIDSIMECIPRGYRFNWCRPGSWGCACSGCVNVAALPMIKSIGSSPLTYDEWVRWMEDNKLVTIEYDGEEYSFTAKEWSGKANNSVTPEPMRTICMSCLEISRASG